MKAQHETVYWLTNADLLIIPSFLKLHTKDKSKGKEESSKIMWAMYYAFHPESKFFHYPNKQETIEKSFIKDPKFKWEAYKDVVEDFKNLVLTDAERALLSWNDIMIMRDNSIKALYKRALEMSDVDELVKIDKMLANTPKMFEDYKKIKKDYEEERTTKKGKKILSLTDSGEI